MHVSQSSVVMFFTLSKSLDQSSAYPIVNFYWVVTQYDASYQNHF